MGSCEQKNCLIMKIIILVFTLSLTFVLSAQENGIMFTEDFESASKEEMLLKWNDSYNTEGMMFSADVPSGSK